MIILAQQDFTYLTSSLLLLLGYACFLTGVISPCWRAEIGYVYGLWQRCDRGVCINYFTGLNHYLSAVRTAMLFGLLSLTAAVVCLFTEMSLKRWMRRSSRRRKHLATLGRVIGVSAGLGEICAAIGLAFYGYRSVLTNPRYPVLLWGVAITGLGVLLCQLASILRAMGPLKYWGRGLCCLAPPSSRGYKDPGPMYPALEMSDYRRQVVVRDVKGVTSCCASQWSDGSSSSTARSYFSTGGGTPDSKHYRHYEEISFQDLADMPPPPPELLDQPAPLHPPILFHRQPVIPYPPQDYRLYGSQPLLHSDCLEIEEAPLPCSSASTAPCCQNSPSVGSSSTWHPQQHQLLQQHQQSFHIDPNHYHHQQQQQQHHHHHHQYMQQQIQQPYSAPQHSPYPGNGQTKQQTARPKARPRGIRNQGASPRVATSAPASRRPSVQSGRRQHRPSGSGSMKSLTCESVQVHRYQTMPVALTQGHQN